MAVGAAAVTAVAMVWAAHRRCGVTAGAMARAVWPAVAGAVPAWFAARFVADALESAPAAIRAGGRSRGRGGCLCSAGVAGRARHSARRAEAGRSHVRPPSRARPRRSLARRPARRERLSGLEVDDSRRFVPRNVATATQRPRLTRTLTLNRPWRSFARRTLVPCRPRRSSRTVTRPERAPRTRPRSSFVGRAGRPWRRHPPNPVEGGLGRALLALRRCRATRTGRVALERVICGLA